MNRNIYRLGAPLLVAIALAGCGGGGGGGGGGGFPLPPTSGGGGSTDSSTDAFIAYVKGLINSALDTAEPADVTAFDPPPTSETLEPVATP
jgi:hypothetical protein